MDTGDIARSRLHTQHIARPTFAQPGQVVSWLGAMQAQDYTGALWSLGLRLPNATDAAIEQALADKAIIRTWPMRGTLHFVAAADVRWMLELLTPRVVAGSVRRRQQLNLDDGVFARSRQVFVAALQGGRQLSRDGMYQVLERAHIATAGQRGLHILWRLAQDGLICFAAREGKQHTFALLDEWVPAAKSLHRAEALAELARRYFTGHGPATVQDFMWWSGLAATDARAGLDMVKARLVHEVFAGKSYWLTPQVPAWQSHHTDVHLLPGFDEYLLGYRDRGAVLDPLHNEKINPGNNGMFSPTIVIDSRVVGTWKRTFVRGSVAMTYSPFSPLSEAQLQAIAVTAERYGRFLGMPVTKVSTRDGPDRGPEASRLNRLPPE